MAFGTDERGQLKVAMNDPADLELVRLVEKRSGLRVVPHYATEAAIRSAAERYAKDLNSAIRSLLDEAGFDGSKPPAGAAAETNAAEQAVVGVVELVLNYAYQHGASDVHVEPREKEIVVRYRIDGILHDVVSLPRELSDSILTRIKVLAKLRTDEHFAAQDGKLQEIMDGERVDIRVSVLPVVDGEKIVMRLLTEKGKKYSLEDLGMLERDLKKLRRHAQKSFGMILATGPTGSGKTTTMYALLKILNTRDVNIATIEDPIEYSLEGVNQIQANPKTGLTFASGLRSIVRQDPDIIMVGEIRDEETAGIAVNASMTGHLVLSTLHTNDAATTLPRFRDMKVEPFLIASTINVIVAQRLVRKICQRCIVSTELSKEELLKLVPEDVAAKFMGKVKRGGKASLFRGKGCDACGHTGYKGRVGIFELLEVDDAVRDLIMKDSDAGRIAKQAVASGMITMFEDGIEKVMIGLTTIDEVIRVTSA
jgi:type IV pilus assembly protein PilB